jgi:hypothetical protein
VAILNESREAVLREIGAEAKCAAPRTTLTRAACAAPALLRGADALTPACARVPGFRKASAAPPQLLINTVGPDKFRNAVAEHLLQATLEEALAPVAESAFSGACSTTAQGAGHAR